MVHVAGFVLVGGQSRRMGRDKALLDWNGQPLVQHVAQLVLEAAGSVTLIGYPQRYCDLGYPCLPDLRPGLGPLSGIETALATGLAERNLVLACDMPKVDVLHLRQLLLQRSPCVVTEDETGRIHPLCAVYDVSCLPAVGAALDTGRLQLLDLVADLCPAILRYSGVLSNINTLEDLASARQ